MPQGVSKSLLVFIKLEGNPEAPDEEYEIEYVYGYRTFDCRQNL